MKVHLQPQKDYWDKLAHTDHPTRHWDRTCPACLHEETEKLKEKLARSEAMLKEPTKLMLIPELMKQAGWRHCAEGQKTTQYCGMAEQARLEEREACAKLCEGMAIRYTDMRRAALEMAAENIRARSYYADGENKG